MSTLLLSLLHRVFPNLNIPVSEEIAVDNLLHLIQGSADRHIPGGSELLRYIQLPRIKKIVHAVIESPLLETLEHLAVTEAPELCPKTPQFAHRWQIAPKDSVEPFVLVHHRRPDGTLQIADAVNRILQDNPKYRNWLNRPFRSALDLLTLCPKCLAVFPQLPLVAQFPEYEDDFLDFVCEAVKISYAQYKTYVPTGCTSTEDENEEEEKQERLTLRDMFFHPKFRFPTPSDHEIPLCPDAASISSSSRAPSPVVSTTHEVLLAPDPPHVDELAHEDEKPHEHSAEVAKEEVLPVVEIPHESPGAKEEVEEVPQLGEPIGVLGEPPKKRARKRQVEAPLVSPVGYGRMTRSQMKRLGNPELT